MSAVFVFFSVQCCEGSDDSTNCTTCWDGSDVAVMQLLRDNIEPLLHSYRVQLGFSGHFHVVERQKAVYQGKVVQNSTSFIDEDGNEVALYNNAQATVWLVVGTAGSLYCISYLANLT
jgi:hypothetical protein